MTDYYAVLGVSPQASVEEIKRAYRKGALQAHPDTQGEITTSRFLLLTEAYQVLTNGEAKENYDLWRRDKKSPPKPPSFDKILNEYLWDMEDLLKDFSPTDLKIKIQDSTFGQRFLEMLFFIDLWTFPPEDFKDPFGHPNPSKMSISNYFYNLRIRVDKHLRGIEEKRLTAYVPQWDRTYLECLFEVCRHSRHYLLYLRGWMEGRERTFPEYNISPPHTKELTFP